MKAVISIPATKCKKGMIIAEPVYNYVGGTIIGQDIALDESMIQKLENLDIKNIKVYKESFDEIERKERLYTPHNIEIKEKYDIQSNILKEVVKDISAGKQLEVEKIDDVVGSLTQTFQKDQDVINCFKMFKDVDEYLYNHSLNVSLLAVLIGKWNGLNENQIKELTYAGLLHDIGKARISFKILNKKEELNPEEEEQIKKHVKLGYDMLEKLPNITKDISMGVLMHHERIDGKGYMLGAVADQIHIYGRIIAIADKYDYYINKMRNNPFKVFENIRKNTFNELDPELTLNFIKKVSGYYIGDIFKLNTGEYAEVIKINDNDISRPLVRIDNTFVDLSEEKNVEFDEVV